MKEFIFLGLLAGLLVFTSYHKHFLLTLLSLEFMVIFFFFYLYINMPSVYSYFSLIFLTFSACEGALGLSILVMMSRSYGGDFISNFNLVS